MYQRVPESCYFLRYTPSFTYTALDLEIRSIPEFSTEGFGLHPPSGNRRPHGPFYNANDRGHVEAAIASVQAALPHALSVDAKSRIAVHIPHLFTFDATRWHRACEQSEVTQAITALLRSLNDIRTRDAEFMPLYPEHAELIQRISQALQDVLDTI